MVLETQLHQFAWYCTVWQPVTNERVHLVAYETEAVTDPEKLVRKSRQRDQANRRKRGRRGRKQGEQPKRRARREEKLRGSEQRLEDGMGDGVDKTLRDNQPIDDTDGRFEVTDPKILDVDNTVYNILNLVVYSDVGIVEMNVEVRPGSTLCNNSSVNKSCYSQWKLTR